MSSIRSRYWRIDRRFFHDSERWGSLLPTTAPSTLLSTINMRCFTVGRGPNLIVLRCRIGDRHELRSHSHRSPSFSSVGWGVLTVVADFNRTRTRAFPRRLAGPELCGLQAAWLRADLVARPVGGRATLLRRAHGSDCVCSVLCRADRDANLWRRGLRRERLSTVRGAHSNHRKEMGAISRPSRFSSSYLRPDSWRSVGQGRADKWATGNARRLICAIRRTLRRVVCGSSEGRRAPAETTRPREARPRLAVWQTQWRPPARSAWRGADSLPSADPGRRRVPE